MLFSVCNGSKKAEQWIVDNMIMVFTSALLMRPASLLGVNVLAPAFCLKFGRYCRCCDNNTGKKNAKEEEDKDAQSAVALSITDNDSVASPERIIARGTYKATHKKGLFHAHSNDFGRSSNDDDGFVDFHTMIVSDANSIASNEQASVGASIKKSEVEMTNMKVT